MKGAKLLPTIFPRLWVYFRYRLCWGGGPERNEFSTLNQFSKLPLERGIHSCPQQTLRKNRRPMDYETLRGLFGHTPQHFVTPSMDKRSGKPQTGKHNRYILEPGEMCWTMKMLIIHHPREFLSFRRLLWAQGKRTISILTGSPTKTGKYPPHQVCTLAFLTFSCGWEKISPKWGKTKPNRNSLYDILNFSSAYHRRNNIERNTNGSRFVCRRRCVPPIPTGKSTASR